MFYDWYCLAVGWQWELRNKGYVFFGPVTFDIGNLEADPIMGNFPISENHLVWVKPARDAYLSILIAPNDFVLGYERNRHGTRKLHFGFFALKYTTRNDHHDLPETFQDDALIPWPRTLSNAELQRRKDGV